LRLCVTVLAIWLALLLMGCGGGSSGTAQFRFLQLSPDAPTVNVFIDRTEVSSNLLYGNSTGYQSVKSGSHHIKIVPVTGSDAILDEALSFSSDSNQTQLLTGPVASSKTVMLTDGGTTAVTGSGHIRVLNASSALGIVDIYVVTAGSGITGATPFATNIGFDQDTGYIAFPLNGTTLGNYTVLLTVPGTTNVLVNTGVLTPGGSTTATKDQTVVVYDGLSGGYNFSVLQDP
jgi:Domain of unknown function (DUF4397)